MFHVTVWNRSTGDSDKFLEEKPLFMAVLPRREDVLGLGQALGGDWLAKSLSSAMDDPDEYGAAPFYANNLYWTIKNLEHG